MITNSDTQLNVTTKSGSELSANELVQIKEALLREFKVPFYLDEEEKKQLFFLLKEEGIILAMGALGEVTPVQFQGQIFTLYAVLHVVANKKGEGYGTKVVTSMREYLIAHDFTGLGFCMPGNLSFYKKCGFSTTIHSTQRFIYKEKDKNITNQDGQFIFYQESSALFMKKVLAHPEENVYIPTPNLW